MRRIGLIALHTALEAWRTRLFVATLAVQALLLLASVWLRQLAITDTDAIAVGFLGVSLRLAAVLVVALQVAGALGREQADRGLELLLSMDMPRALWFAGRLAGFILLGAAVALLCGTTLRLGGATDVWAWGLSLAMELALVAALTQFCAISLTHLVAALSFVLGFYLLGRSIRALQLIGAAPLPGTDIAQRAVAGTIDILALVLPDLSAFCRTGWLTGQLPVTGLGTVAVQTLVYLALLCGAGLVDLYRRDVG